MTEGIDRIYTVDDSALWAPKIESVAQLATVDRRSLFQRVFGAAPTDPHLELLLQIYQSARTRVEEALREHRVAADKLANGEMHPLTDSSLRNNVFNDIPTEFSPDDRLSMPSHGVSFTRNYISSGKMVRGIVIKGVKEYTAPGRYNPDLLVHSGDSLDDFLSAQLRINRTQGTWKLFQPMGVRDGQTHTSLWLGAWGHKDSPEVFMGEIHHDGRTPSERGAWYTLQG